MTPSSALFGLLAVFFVSWVGAALWAGQTVAALPGRAQMLIYGGAFFAFLLLAGARQLFPALRVRLWQENLQMDWALVAVCAIGFAWCWWARLHLGTLWSAGVSRKEGHSIVDTGPYGIVRHPIYTGAIVAVFAFSGVRASLFAFLVALLVTCFFALKARMEERFLRQELGAGYDAYRQRVPMLVPFLRLRAPDSGRS